MNPTYLTIIILLLYHTTTQPIRIGVFPDQNYNQTVASPQACLASCRSCQVNTLQCQQCLSPYFVKAQDGSCQFADGYTLESSNNQILQGNAFAYTRQSWGTLPQQNCSLPQRPNGLRVMGPFSSTNVVTYRRTLSFHQYIIIRFQLITIDWKSDTSLNVSLFDQGGTLVASRIVKNHQNVPKQRLCSSTPLDRRFSVTFQIPDTQITTLTVNFTLNSTSPSQKYAIATWMLVTGQCDPSCYNCSYSNSPNQCIGCRRFFILGSDQRCSQCATGFRLRSIGQTTSCQKCPIQYNICTPGQQLCYYSQLAQQLNLNCSFLQSSNYNDNKYLNSVIFPGSLFTVSGKPATYNCGGYSIVGKAQKGDIITRMISQMPVHIFVSLTFNVFGIDQPANNLPSIFIVILDNNVLQASYLTLSGITDECDGRQLQAFATYPATKFYPHTKLDNVNLTITSNASNWGIRNVRLAYKICDQSCLRCGPNGCLQCAGNIQLQDLQCKKCPSGFGFKFNSTLECQACPQNCKTCVARNRTSDGTNSTGQRCVQCTSAFYLFEDNCLKKTNIGQTVPLGSTPTGSNPGWTTITPSGNNTNGTNPLNGTNGTSTPSSNQCKLNISSGAVDFIVTQDRMSQIVTLPQIHHKILVQFHLIRIDRWLPQDRLDLYLNDLLIFSKNYTSFGNQICFDPNQTDFVSFQTIQMIDSNNTLTAAFQVFGSQGRKFGIANFKVYPIGCQKCLEYPFSYKVDYAYDQKLWVHLQFNRVYNNYNNTRFKQIFSLMVAGSNVPYQVYRQNGVRYVLEATVNKDINRQLIKVKCNFPQLVTADTQDQINKQPFFTSRMLQANPQYQTLKTIDNIQSSILLQRYTPVDSSAINGLRIFFQIISRATIYIGFALFFFGCQTGCTHMMHNLQKIWLHMFIASLAIPSTLKFALRGFRQTQNQNIAIHPSVWQQPLPRQLYYQTPADYQQYFVDIGFFRNIYNIAIAFLILVIVYVVIRLIVGSEACMPRSLQGSKFLRHMKITFVKRPFFYINSIVFYQYLTLVLVCTFQFLDISNKTNKSAYSGVNAAGAIIAFIIATIYPLFHFFYLNLKATHFGADRKIQYANRYSQIFFRFLPRDIWAQGRTGITYAQRLYNLFRFGQLWWYAVVVTAVNGNPQAQCYLIGVMNLLHLILVLFFSLNYTLYFRLLKVVQLGLFAGLEIIILVCQSQQQTMTRSSLNTLGAVGVALVFIIVVFSVIRVVYTLWKIYSQYDNTDVMMLAKYVNLKTRNQDYFQSRMEELMPSERA